MGLPLLAELPCGQRWRLVGTRSCCGDKREAWFPQGLAPCFCPQTSPSLGAGKAGEGEDIKNAATTAPLGHLTHTHTQNTHTRMRTQAHTVPIAYGEGTVSPLWTRKQRISKEVGRKLHICSAS